MKPVQIMLGQTYVFPCTEPSDLKSSFREKTDTDPTET